MKQVHRRSKTTMSKTINDETTLSVSDRMYAAQMTMTWVLLQRMLSAAVRTTDAAGLLTEEPQPQLHTCKHRHHCPLKHTYRVILQE